MRELKEKIITLRCLKGLFYLFFVLGLISFICVVTFENVHFIRNGSISLVFMASGYIFNEISNYKINQFLNQFKFLKQKKIKNKSVVIEFNKIA